ncbi:hypothetical protein C6503_00865 [Candidatus Poribacteria bacterium]|nr:MAG: hypothetical protein C6503_00865 [Candidatus Poribacteria bacterium]
MLHEFNEKELSITENGAPILTCHHGSDVGCPPYLHPLYAPNGQVMTDDTNIGHQHPPGICFTRGTVNNAQLDYDEITRDTEADSARFSIVTTWRNSAEPLLIETWTTEIHPRQTEVQVLDIAISLQAPSSSLKFAENIGLSCLTAEMEYRKSANADGRIGESEVNGDISAWGTLCGLTTAEQEAVGIAIFPHPSNGDTTFLAEDASFGYLFAQATPFTADANTTHTLKYRVLAYTGDLFTVDLWEYYQDYTSM